jgi:hypothetical protein
MKTLTAKVIRILRSRNRTFAFKLWDVAAEKLPRGELRAVNKLMATTRIGREVPKVRRQRYSTDDERGQHRDDSGEHRPIIGLNSSASNTLVTVRNPTVCRAQNNPASEVWHGVHPLFGQVL